MKKKPCPVDPRRPEELDMAGLADCGRNRGLGLQVDRLACADKQASLLLPWLSGRSHSQRMSEERTGRYFSNRRKASGQPTCHWASVFPLPQPGFQAGNSLRSQPSWLKERKTILLQGCPSTESHFPIYSSHRETHQRMGPTHAQRSSKQIFFFYFF